MIKIGQNSQNFVKKLTSITEFKVDFDENHSQLPFSMVFIDLDTYLIDILNLEISHTTLVHFPLFPCFDRNLKNKIYATSA